ncbi:DNA mismatch repair protein MutL [uncultured archaeon]|nr:DNA mismatch repair protein MutL [uncultured archaeon]
MADYEEVPPNADTMVASIRAIGYNLPMAIADIIDNSIYARAKNIWIDYDWAGGDPWIRVKDDGRGMTDDELREAMRLCGKGPDETRDPEDLGRFGLGLKTASFSQCRLLTVSTKVKGGTTSTRCWDLDVIEKTKKWQLRLLPPENAEPMLENLDHMENGTVVLWQQLDRVVDKHDDIKDAETVFNTKFIDVAKHIEMVFHRYMSGPTKLNISIGRTPLKPWDPYLTSNQFTQELSTEKYEDGSIIIIPYVLPHVSKRTATETTTGAGPKGWNAQQGFYIYRNRRMIVSGGYLDFALKPEEHYKLGRIMVDLKNDMDTEWRIDVRKAVAIPPDRLRSQLEKVAKATREEAVKIYRARIGRPRKLGQKNIQEVWTKRRKGDKIVYEINRDNESIRRILAEFVAPERWIRKLFGTIERTVPHREIIIDSCNKEDCHVDLPPDISRPDQGLIDMCVEIYKERRAMGRPHDEAVAFVLSIEPFNIHPAFQAALDKKAEEEDSWMKITK